MLLADARQAVMAAAGALAKGQMLAPLLGRPGSALGGPCGREKACRSHARGRVRAFIAGRELKPNTIETYYST